MILCVLNFNCSLSSTALWTNAGLVVHVQVANQLSGHSYRHNADFEQNLRRCASILRSRPVSKQIGLSTQHHAG